MTSKLRAGRRERGRVSAVSERVVDPTVVDPELEAEVAAVAAWFGALSADLRAHFDREAQLGREAYPWP